MRRGVVIVIAVLGLGPAATVSQADPQPLRCQATGKLQAFNEEDPTREIWDVQISGTGTCRAPGDPQPRQVSFTGEESWQEGDQCAEPPGGSYHVSLPVDVTVTDPTTQTATTQTEDWHSGVPGFYTASSLSVDTPQQTERAYSPDMTFEIDRERNVLWPAQTLGARTEPMGFALIHLTDPSVGGRPPCDGPAEFRWIQF